MKKRICCAAVLIGFSLTISLAQAGDYGSSSGVILKNHFSPRADGMAGAQTAAIVNQDGALSYNPAGLVDSKQQALSAVAYRGLVEDMYGAFNYSANLSQTFAVGGSVLIYDAGQFDLIDANGRISSFNAQRDILANITLAYKSGFLNEPIDVGINLKLLHSTLLDQYSAVSVAGDIGFRWQLDSMLDNLAIGAVIKNIGTPMKYVEQPFDLPLTASAGAACQVLEGDKLGLLLAADVQCDLQENWQQQVGAELMIMDQVAIRGGYKFGHDVQGLTLGVGLRLEGMQLDYAFNLTGALNHTHRAGLTYVINKLPEQTTKDKKQAQGKQELDISNYHKQVQQPDQAINKIPAQILQVEKTGGRVSGVLLNAGHSQGIQVGYKGVIVNAAGQAVAGIRIQEANVSQSIAEVLSISRDLGKKPSAVIYKHAKTENNEEEL